MRRVESRKLHRRKAVAVLAEQLRGGHAAILEHDFVGVEAADHRNLAHNVEAGRALVDEKGGDAAAHAEGLVGDGHEDGEVGFGDAADPDFAAVDYPVVAVALGAGFHRGRIAAGARLGDADGRDRFAARVGLEIERALLIVDRRHQHAQVRRIGRQGIGRNGLADLFVDSDHRDGGQIRAAELGGRVETPQPKFVRLFVDYRALFGGDDGAAAGRLACEHGTLKRNQLIVHEAANQVLEHLMLFTERKFHLQSPSKRGR